MFGHLFFGLRYFAQRYFGQAAGVAQQPIAAMDLTVSVFGATAGITAYQATTTISGVEET